jgi:hypothetical protein
MCYLKESTEIGQRTLSVMDLDLLYEDMFQ